MATQIDADASGWRFAQCFGDKTESNEDITEVRKAHAARCELRASRETLSPVMERSASELTLGTGRHHLDRFDSAALALELTRAVEFDHNGDYLATGDKGGRVVLFQRCADAHVRRG